MAEINIFFDNESGEIKVEAEGYRGFSCATDIDTILAIIGALSVKIRNKPEIYEEEVKIRQRR